MPSPNLSISLYEWWPLSASNSALFLVPSSGLNGHRCVSWITGLPATLSWINVAIKSKTAFALCIKTEHEIKMICWKNVGVKSYHNRRYNRNVDSTYQKSCGFHCQKFCKHTRFERIDFTMRAWLGLRNTRAPVHSIHQRITITKVVARTRVSFFFFH